MNKKSLLLAFISLLVISKSFAQLQVEKKGWPSDDRYAFISECIKTAKAGLGEDSARYYCYCMQFKIETKFPTVAAASAITEEDMQTPEWQKEVKSCVAGGSWTSKDRSEFLSNCIKSAKEGLGEQKAKSYCECMMYKIEVRYPNAADAAKLTEEKLNSPEWKKITQSCLDF